MEENRHLISEASKALGIEPHVLRYWEEELALAIHRNEMGHRYYTDSDLRVLRRVHELKDQGFQLKALKIIVPQLYANQDLNLNKMLGQPSAPQEKEEEKQQRHTVSGANQNVIGLDSVRSVSTTYVKLKPTDHQRKASGGGAANTVSKAKSLSYGKASVDAIAKTSREKQRDIKVGVMAQTAAEEKKTGTKPSEQEPAENQAEKKPVKQESVQEQAEGKAVKQEPAQNQAEKKPVKQESVQEQTEGKPVKQQFAQEQAEGKPVKQQSLQEQAEGKPVKQESAQKKAEKKPSRQEPAQKKAEKKPSRQEPAQKKTEEKPSKQASAQGKVTGKQTKQQPVQGKTKENGKEDIVMGKTAKNNTAVAERKPQDMLSNEHKLAQFQEIMNLAVSKALAEQQHAIGEAMGSRMSEEVSERVSDKVLKQMDYLMRESDDHAEARYKKLDETIREVQKARMEAAAAGGTVKKKGFFHKKEKKDKKK